ncbi:putative disease resistance protein RGA4 [Miscanthus floridulus]|uniref:putative disease resistance protein RGA4 n=1 Tax=Miscanthus floridulus TaxID=154761 RepID=UPI003459AA87
MAIPWSIAATGWTVTVVGWLLSPIISMILNKLSAYLIFDASKELDKLEDVTVPALRETLRDVEEQRMVMRDKRSRSHLQGLDKLDTRLKSALCQAEDILDLVDYHRIEKELTGGDDGRWVQRLIQAAGASIVALGRGSWASVQRVLHASGACIAFYCIDITPAPLLQLVHSMKQKLGQFFGGWSSGEGVLPVSQATSTVGVQRLCGWCSHLTSCCRSVFSWSAQRIAEARRFRDWSYEQVGIKSDLQKDGNVPITGRIRLRKQIQGIADILTSSKKSDLLNQNRSSTSKNSAKESSSKQKEIDELYRVIEQKVFGRDKDRADIIRMLREGPDTNAPSSSTVSPYSVIGIYGITGSGKSTLAQYVCDYEKKAGHFDPVMFVLVGKTFSVGNIFRDMLEQITQSRPSKDNDLESLKAELKKELKDKCFLLVLDDVWVNSDNMKERRILLDVLLVGQSGSRILVTAQKTDAAAALGAQEKMQIPIPDLEEEQYLSMFMHYALEDSQVTGNDYERYTAIGRKITKRLRRSPIAAITVAARLKSESRIDFWERTSNLDVLDETMGALWWSYQQLGVDIRRCFTYCSIFPKAYILGRDEIVDLWIAQGFVNTRNNGTEELEDIGQSYFDELQTFSFLQV